MKKLFTEKQVGLSAILGGPIPPGILFYLNYKRINKDKEAYISLALTLIFTITLFFMLTKLPEEILDKIPNMIFTAAYGAMVYVFYNRFLSKEINQLLNEGHTKASNWAVAGITLLGLTINLLIIFTLAFYQPAFPGEKLNYGAAGHEIYYNDDTTQEADAIMLGSVLTETGYFTDEYSIAVYLDTQETGHFVTLQIDQEHWDNPEITMYLTDIKHQLETAFSSKVTLILEHYSPSGKKSEKRI